MKYRRIFALLFVLILSLTACGKDVIIVVQTMDITGHQMASFTMGGKVNFTFNGNVAHVFSKETGVNLEAAKA